MGLGVASLGVICASFWPDGGHGLTMLDVVPSGLCHVSRTCRFPLGQSNNFDNGVLGPESYLWVFPRRG